MRFLGQDLDEEFVVTRGYLVMFGGMMLALVGLSLTEGFDPSASNIIGMILVLTGIVFLGVALVFGSRGGNLSKRSVTKTQTGIKS